MRLRGCLRPLALTAVWGAALAWAWPRVAPRLFPAPPEAPAVPAAVVDAESVVARALATWGAPSGEVVQLPRGRGAEALQALLRQQPELAGAEVYVTPDEDLAFRLRVLAGTETLLDRPVLPWLPPRPPAPADDPPVLALLVEVPDPTPERIEALAALPLPLGIALPPFAAGTLGAVRAALRDRVDIVLSVGDGPLAEQRAAVPEASALRAARAGEASLPWLVDAGCGPRADCAAVVHHDAGEDRLRAIALRRGGAVLLVDEAHAALGAGWLGAARDDGYRLGFPAEAIARRTAAPR